MSFRPDSERDLIESLKRQIDELADSQLNAIPSNDIALIHGSLGRRNAAHGGESGIRSSQPVIHAITDVDIGGSATGVFDKINVASEYVIVDGTGSNLSLRWLQRILKNGQRIILTPVQGKTLTLETGGNLDIASAVTISDSQTIQLYFDEDSDITADGGAKLPHTGSGGSGSPLRTKGDLYGFDTGNARIPVGADGQVLVADSAAALGVQWQNVSGVSPLLSNLTVDVSKDWAGFAITNLSGIDLFANLAANPVTNASFLSFISDAAVPRGQVGRSEFFGTADGTTINIPDGQNLVISVDTVEKLRLDDTNDIFLSHVSFDLLSNHITNLDYIESDAPDRPGSGFVRMGTAEEIRMRNPDNDDDLVITSGNDAQSNQSVIVLVAGGSQLTISEFDVDVVDNRIVNTGDILPGTGPHTVGDSIDFYNEMHSQYFIPENSTIIANRYGLAKTGNALYVNYDGANADAGFAIHEQGIRQFLFYNPSSSVVELFIGPDPFEAGETFRVRMGENSSSSAVIEYNDADLILNRLGVGTANGVQVQIAGLTMLRITSAESKFFSDVNVNSQDVTNVQNVLAGSSGLATIGEFQPSNGGFDYVVRNRISWESDADTYIEFDSGGIGIVSDDAVAISSTDTMNIFIAAGTGLNVIVNGSSRATIQDNGLVLSSGTSLFVQSNFAQFAEIATPPNPPANEGRMYARDVGGITTPMWLDPAGTETSMIESASGQANLGANVGGGTGTIFRDKTGVMLNFKTLVAGSDITISNNADDIEISASGGGSQTPVLQNIDYDGFNAQDVGAIEFRDGEPAPASGTYIYKQSVNLVHRVPSGDGHLFYSGTSLSLGIGLSAVNVYEEMDMQSNRITNLADGTAASDAVNLGQLQDAIDLSGLQDARHSTDHETAQLDAEYWVANAKQGDLDSSAIPQYSSPAQEQIYFLPVYLGSRCRIERAGVEVGVLGVNDWSVAIYDSYSAQNYPRTRLTGSSNQFLSATGITSVLFNLDVEPGLYWIAVWFDNGNASTLRYLPSLSLNAVGWTPTNGTAGAMRAIHGYLEAGHTSPTLPATAPDEMASLYIDSVPAVFAKLAFNPN